MLETLNIVIVLLLVLANGFFVASEFASVTPPSLARLPHSAAENDLLIQAAGVRDGC